jgi:hypothetical protein
MHPIVNTECENVLSVGCEISIWGETAATTMFAVAASPFSFGNSGSDV